MIRACDLPDWICADQAESHGCWTVRERHMGLNSEQPPLLLIASGTEENMRAIAATINALRFLAELVRSETLNPARVKTKAAAILKAAGVEP